MTKNSPKDSMVVVPENSEKFAKVKGTYVMFLAPGDHFKLQKNDTVEPLDVYDLCDPQDLRRMADVLEGLVEVTHAKG